MERLTYYCDNGMGAGEWRANICGKEVSGVHITRLAAYENSGLEPGEIAPALSGAGHSFLGLACELQAYRNLGQFDHLSELVQAEMEGRLLVLPCKVGDPVWRIYDDCDFTGECGTKRMCQGCEYRNLFVEEQPFCISMLNQSGKLESPYHKTREEAEVAREAKERR